jgi:serine/threonine protein kinase
MIDAASLCMGCMEVRSSAGECARCGYGEQEPESPLHLRPRTELHGQYLIGRVLGHGGFGVTYLAWDLNLERKIAIKEYLPSGVAMRTGQNSQVIPYSGEVRKDFEWGLERYLDEARTVARFQNHPSIVSVLNFFRGNGTAYLVMEYLEGGTFDKYLQAHGGRTDIETSLKVMVPVLDALGAVHEAGILHRDISPDNIYITRTWQVKVLDFGAARYALGSKSRNLSVILKEGFAPVEQYHSKGNQGPWTDIYACGATLFRSLTAKTPPPALERLHQDELQPPSAFGAQIAPHQERALMKALALRPEDRFLSMQAFKEALTAQSAPPPTIPAGELRFQESVPYLEFTDRPAPAPPTAPVQKMPPPVPPPRPPAKSNLKPILAGMAGVVLAIAGVAGYVQWEEHKRKIEREKQIEIARVREEEQRQRRALEEQQRLREEQLQRERDAEQFRLQREKEELQRQRDDLNRKQILEKQRLEQQRLEQQRLEQQRLEQQRLEQQRLQQQRTEQIRQEQLRQQQLREEQLRRQQAERNRPPFSPQPQAGYEDLLRLGDNAARMRNYRGAADYYLQAVRADPNRPQAYANIGWLYLYQLGDMQGGLNNYRRAVELGGVVYFLVHHDHTNLSFQQYCSGNLGISRTRIGFTDQRGQHNFAFNKNELREVKENRFPFKQVQGDFHIKTNDGRNYNLVSAGNAMQIRNIILELGR